MAKPVSGAVSRVVARASPYNWTAMGNHGKFHVMPRTFAKRLLPTREKVDTSAVGPVAQPPGICREPVYSLIGDWRMFSRWQPRITPGEPAGNHRGGRGLLRIGNLPERLGRFRTATDAESPQKRNKVAEPDDSAGGPGRFPEKSGRKTSIGGGRALAIRSVDATLTESPHRP